MAELPEVRTQPSLAERSACPPSEVVDRIVHFDEVREGDLMVYVHEMRLVRAVVPVQSVTGVEFAGFLLDGEHEMHYQPAEGYTAVRRYKC